MIHRKRQRHGPEPPGEAHQFLAPALPGFGEDGLLRNQAHRHQQRERRGGFQQGADINGQCRIHGKQQPSLGESLTVLLKKAPQPVSIAGAQHAQDMVRAAKAADGKHVI